MSNLTDRLRCAKFTVHATETGSVCAELDDPSVLVEAADTIDHLTRELANARAADIHSCHADCTRAGCVNARLREDAERYRWLRDGDLGADYPYPVMREGTDGMNDRTIWFDELDAAIDHAMGARKATP